MSTPATTGATTPIETITKIGKDLVDHCNASLPDGADPIAHDGKLWDAHFASSWTSVEGDGSEFVGREAIEGKYRWWMDNFECHEAKATGPFVGPGGFSVIFDMDVEPKDGSRPRGWMKEIANYTVEDGKIVREVFCYDANQGG
ncbi:MAG: SnoaL-like domain-containing protein [Planctomycetota bacterium]